MITHILVGFWLAYNLTFLSKPHNYVTFKRCIKGKPKNKAQGENSLIEITQEESKIIRSEFPSVHINITNRNKAGKRKRYYMEENRAAVALIYRLRGIENKGGSKHGRR